MNVSVFQGLGKGNAVCDASSQPTNSTDTFLGMTPAA